MTDVEVSDCKPKKEAIRLKLERIEDYLNEASNSAHFIEDSIYGCEVRPMKGSDLVTPSDKSVTDYLTKIESLAFFINAKLAEIKESI